MAFDTNYPNRKDRRRPYRDGDSRNFMRSCRNNGTCDYCRSNRMHSIRKAIDRAEAQLRNFETDTGGEL